MADELTDDVVDEQPGEDTDVLLDDPAVTDDAPDDTYADDEPGEDDVADDESGDDEWVTDDIEEMASGYGLNSFQLHTLGRDKFFELAAKEDAKIAALKDQPIADQKEPDKKKREPLPDPDPNEYDELTIRLIEDHKALQNEFREFVQRQNEAAAQQQRAAIAQVAKVKCEQFHDIMDELDEEMFGRSIVDGNTVELGDSHNESRRKVWEAMDQIELGEMHRAKRDGREYRPLSRRSLIQRAVNMVHGETIRAKDRKSFSEKVSRQSRRRRGAGANQRLKVDTEDRNLADDPDITAAWERLTGRKE